MKKVLSIIICAALMLAVFAGCGAKKPSGDKLHIIATIYPEYEWVKQITEGADNVKVSLLLDSGADLHNFQPSVKDITDISSSDVFIYNGGESDEWVDSVLSNAQNKDMLALDLMEHEEEEDEKEYDEHSWLSLKNASFLCQKIADRLSEKDPDNKDTYAKNAKAYIEKLNKLDGEYEQTCSSVKNDTLIFADRFPFRYMTDDYKLNYYAAFSGCSAQSDPKFETIVFLANKLDELKLDHLMIIDGSDDKLAKSVIDAAKTKDVKILTLNSMQSAVGDNSTYLGIMEDNLKALKEALN